ncbi:T3SS (YopN, CesT) and YbjN peptide-binding chaperone 1 [Altericista sp. CCNU0014]|uniref:T3SS (YopN, CesT) and YbjN peptide-binding chaperone 1 n=1 Tax=Altericista sp. CCNU0014 TaxID=3082949 RepID=UPI00384FBA2E
MDFQSPVQEKHYTKVSGWMRPLFGDIPWEKLDEPGFGLFMGSAWVEVRILPWKEDTVVNVRSTVVSDATLTADLLNYLLRENHEMRFGAFSVSKDGDILFEHTIVGSTIDKRELEASVIAVLEIADKYDDEIVARWGGKRALDKAP